MATASDRKPELSYVLAATTTDEVHKAAAWLRTARISERVEIVLAAPGQVLGRVAGRVIPSWVRLASADNTPDRKVIQVAGARQTTGAVVIVVSCGDDLDAKVQDPFAAEGSPDEGPEPPLWAGNAQVALPPAMVAVRV